MSESSSPSTQSEVASSNWVVRGVSAIGLTAFVGASFVVVSLVAGAILYALAQTNVPLDEMNQAVVSSLLAAGVYTLFAVTVIGLPWLLYKKRTNLEELGLQRLPNWLDIVVVPAAVVVYFIATGIAAVVAERFIPWYVVDQAQETGFTMLTAQYEYVLAFIAIVIVAPFIEEVLFRGYLYSKLRKIAGVAVAVLLSSLLFGAIHGQWNVAVDTFVLAVVACGVRGVTGAVWGSVLLHASKNGIAFYLLFINPSLLSTLGG